MVLAPQQVVPQLTQLGLTGVALFGSVQTFAAQQTDTPLLLKGCPVVPQVPGEQFPGMDPRNCPEQVVALVVAHCSN